MILLSWIMFWTTSVLCLPYYLRLYTIPDAWTANQLVSYPVINGDAVSSQIAIRNWRQETAWNQDEIGTKKLSSTFRRWFASEKNLCGIMKMPHNCAPRHRKESGSQESCRFEKFRGDRFPGIMWGGRGHPDSFLYVSTAARAVAAEGSPPILRAAEVDDCAALVQYMADHCAERLVTV